MWQLQCIPECWITEPRANGRAEELAATQEGAVLIYKVNLSFNLFRNFIGKRSLKWITKGVKVLRRVEDGESQDVAWNARQQMNWYMWTSLHIWEEDFPWVGPANLLKCQERTTIGDKKSHYQSFCWLAGWTSEQIFRLDCYVGEINSELTAAMSWWSVLARARKLSGRDQYWR